MAPMKVKKYVLTGGYVRSVRGGGLHYITPGKLRELYGLLPKQCLLTYTEEQLLGRHGQELIFLYPDPSGGYKLPGEGEE